MDNLRAQPSFSAMSSAQRSASMDNIVRQVEALTAEVIDLKARAYAIETVMQQQSFTAGTHAARIDAHAGIVLRQSFMARLKWLVTGR